MNETSISKRYAVKLCASLISGVVGIILVAIVPNAIGPTAYGQFVYIQQSFTKIIGLLDASTSTALFTKISARPERKELLPIYSLYSVIIMMVLICVLITIKHMGYLKIIFPSINTIFIYWGIAFVYLTWISQVFTKISDAYALTVGTELIKILNKLISLAILYLLIQTSNLTLLTYLQYNSLSVILLIAPIYLLLRHNKVIKGDRLRLEIITITSTISEFYKYCSPLIVYSAVMMLSGLFDIWLLQSVSGSIETGFYGLAYSIAAMAFVFTAAMTGIITREFSKSFETKNILQAKVLYSRYIPMFYSFATYFSVFLAFNAEQVISTFAGAEFNDAHFCLIILSFYPIHQTYGQLSGSIFYASGNTSLYRNIGLTSALLGLPLTLLLIFQYELGSIGLAIKMTVIQIIAVNIQLYFNSKTLGLKMLTFVWHQIYSAVIFISAAFISTFYDHANPMVEFIISGIIYTVIITLTSVLHPGLFSLKRTELQLFIKRSSLMNRLRNR